MSFDLPLELQEFGKELLTALDETQDKPTSMFWTKAVNPNEWILFIAFPAALEKVEREQGVTRDAIGKRVVNLIKKLNYRGKEFKFITASPRNSLIYALSALLVTESDAVAQVKMSNNFVNDRNTGENFVYRLSLPNEYD